MNIENLLHRRFGYTSFRTGQKEIIEDLLAGHDVVAMLPTGAGKSICYQLPGLVVNGSTVIVSPLLSLMEDQVQQLKSFGEKRVIGLNSFLPYPRRKQVLRTLNRYRFIFVSPEILQSAEVIQALQSIQVSLFVVDEAHCISQWGHEFRTDYLKLDSIRLRLGNPPCLALTATATREVLNDIILQLKLEDVSEHIYSIDRPNISLRVEKLDSLDEKVDRAVEYIHNLQGPGIIYFSSRFWTEKMSELLRTRGIERTAYYHGGMDNDNRLLIQQQFIEGQLDVICCTNAFGMGINKANVRYVIHFHYPANLESYVQEMGRAGRDGKSSIAILLYSPEDHDLTRSLLNIDTPNDRDLEYVFGYLSQVSNQTEFDIGQFEQEMMTLYGISEVKCRFIRYQLEERKVFLQKGLNRNINLERVKEQILQAILDRLQLKEEHLLFFRRWLVTKSCRRNALLSFFGQSLLGPRPSQCCDNCGVQLEQYESGRIPNPIRTEGILMNWEEELKTIFNRSGERCHD